MIADSYLGKKKLSFLNAKCFKFIVYMIIFGFCVMINIVWKTKDTVTYISVSYVVLSGQVSVRAKWKTEINPFQNTATKINSF